MMQLTGESDLRSLWAKITRNLVGDAIGEGPSLVSLCLLARESMDG